MMGNIRAEARKLLSVRSTYYLIAFSVFIVLLYAGFITGYRITQLQLHDPTYLSQQVLGAVQAVSIFGSIVGLLLFAHEYRYNTIIYTLTLSKSRSRVLAAKLIVVTIFAVIFTVVVMALSPFVTVLGAHLHGYHLVPQTLHYGNLVWRSLIYGWGHAMYALILIALIRNQIGAIVALLVTPIAIENILSLLLKSNTKFLPFSALDNVVNTAANVHGPAAYSATPAFSALVGLTYIVVGVLVAWLLFLKRDAN